MSHHYQSNAYKVVKSTNKALYKEGTDCVYEELVKYYLNSDGLKKAEQSVNDEKTAAQSYNAAVTVTEANKLLDEIALVK